MFKEMLEQVMSVSEIARIASARRLLRMIYYMLKKQMNYGVYQRYRMGVG